MTREGGLQAAGTFPGTLKCHQARKLAAASRASLDRKLDPSNPSLTVASLGKAAAALGRKVELRFVPA